MSIISIYSHASSPYYKNGHLGSTALACSVPLALEPQSGSALAASPEFLAAEARDGGKNVGDNGLNTRLSHIDNLSINK